MNVDAALTVVFRHMDPTPAVATAARVLALEIIRLRAAAIPKDTRKDEWPELGQSFHEWDEGLWEPNIFIDEACMRGHLWFPAPPPPEDG